MDNQIKGFEYEKFIRDYIIKEYNVECYLWSETPETLLIEKNIIGSHNEARLTRKENKENPLRDTGVDLIILNNGKISFVQCKNGYNNGLVFSDLAGISLWTLTHYDLIEKSYIYYTSKLSPNIKSLPKSNKLEFIRHPLKSSKLSNIKMEITPYEYQTEATNKFKEYYKENDNWN